MGPGQYPRYTDARKGKPWVARKGTTDDNDSTVRLKHFFEHLHGPQSYEALSMHGDENTFRNQQEVPQEIPQENSEKQPDHIFKVIKMLNVMDQLPRS